MFSGLFGGYTNHYNPNEPRDWHGRWTTGELNRYSPVDGSPGVGYGKHWRGMYLNDGSEDGRTKSILGYTARELRTGRFPLPDQETVERYKQLLQTWATASNLDDQTFRERYVGHYTDPEKTEHLRAAAAAFASGDSFGKMADAGWHLAAAVRNEASGVPNGVGEWPRNLQKMEELAAKAKADAEAPSLFDRLFGAVGEAINPFGTAHAEGAENEEEMRDEANDPVAKFNRALYDKAFDDYLCYSRNGHNGPSVSNRDYWPSSEDVARMQRLASEEARYASEDISGLYKNRKGAGHGFDQHKSDWRSGLTRDGYKNIIFRVLMDPMTERAKLINGRTIYYSKRENVFVVINPRDADRGTAFKPREKEQYFLDLKTREGVE